MRLADRASQSIGRLWDRDQVHVIGHQAVGPDRDVLSAAEPGHQFQVALVILVTEESLLPAVPPLSDVMRQARCNTRADRAITASYSLILPRSRIEYGVPGTWHSAELTTPKERPRQ